MSFSWTFAADAYGFRFTSFSNSLVPGGIALDPWRLGSVHTFQHPSPRAEVEEIAEAMSPGAYDFSDVNDFVYPLESSVVVGTPAYEWTTYGVVDPVAEALILRPKLVMAAWAGAATVFRAVTFEQVLAPIGGDAATCRVMVPGYEHELWKWTDARFDGEGYTWRLPGFAFAGGENGDNPPGDTALLPYDQPGGGILDAAASASTPELYFWNNSDPDPTARVGVLYKFMNTDGQARLVNIRKEGASSLRLTFTFVPRDCSVGISKQSDTDFAGGLLIRPMLGTHFHALRWSGEQEQADAWPAFANGLIGANAQLSNVASRLLVLGYNQGAALLGTFAPVRETYARLRDFLGLEADEIICPTYGADAGAVPLTGPMVLDSAVELAAMFDDDLGPITYDNIAEPRVPIVAGISPTPGFVADGVIRTRAGSYVIPGYGDFPDLPITGEAAGDPVGAAGGNVHYFLTLLDPTDNAELIDIAEAGYAALAGKQRGRFADTRGFWSAPPNDDFRLTPDQRSIGATYYASAVRAFLELQRSRLVYAGDDVPALLAEWPNPFSTIGSVDTVYVRPIYPPGAEFFGRTCLSVQTKYGRVVRTLTHGAWGAGPGSRWAAWNVPDWANPTELHNAALLRWWTSSIPAPLLRIWNEAGDTAPGFIAEPGEAGYPEFLAAGAHYQFLADLYAHPLAKELVLELQTKAVVLMELASSMTERALDYELDGIDPQVPAGKAGSLARYLPARDVVVLGYGNWSMTTGHPATVTLADTLTLAGYPELGASPRDVWLWNVTGGRSLRLPLPAWSGSSYAVSLSIPPGFVGFVLMVPAGTAPPFMGQPAPASSAIGSGSTVQSATGSPE